MFSPWIKSPKVTYFLGVSCSWPHPWQPYQLPRQDLAVSTTWSPWGAAGKTQKFARLLWQHLMTAPQNISPSEVHMGCHLHLLNLCQKGSSCLPEARDTKEGEVGGLQHHPKEDPGGGMEKAMLWGHSWRFTLWRRRSMLEEAPLCTPTGKTHPGAEMPLKGVCESRAELRKWEKKPSKSSKKITVFWSWPVQHLIKGTEHNMKWRQREWRLWRRQERHQKKRSTEEGQEKYFP